MKIELWTWKFSGKNKGYYTFWRSISGEIIPPNQSIFIYKTKTGKATEFIVNHTEFEAQYGTLVAQLCIKQKRDKDFWESIV